MSQTKIEKLTPEQEALIPFYWEKWRANALSTEPIDRQKASEAVKAAYTAIGFQEPSIFFCDSPYVAVNLNFKLEQLKEHQRVSKLLCPDKLKRWNPQIAKLISNQVWQQIDEQFFYLVDRRLWQLHQQLYEQSDWLEELPGQIIYFIDTKDLAYVISIIDFCISVLNCIHKSERLRTLQSLVKYCGWIIPFEKTCIVCDRPRKLSFDSEDRLHAEGEPAIQFADGYSLYSYHGVTLPEKYGKLHSNQWRSQWLLEEDNAELRRVLIQGIGYNRICQELEAVELDLWQEYALLKIDVDVDEEPIYLLKMICPSTGFIHVLRVPPDMHSAKEAIRWVNWETAPEEFSVQT